MHRQRTSHPPQLRVVWIMTGDLRPYRIPFLERLAAHPGVVFEFFHGPTKEGSGAPSDTPELGAMANRVTAMRAVRWPFGRKQVAWLFGTWQLLTGDFDVLICQETVNNLSIWVLAFLHRFFGKRFVLHGWGYRPDNPRKRLSTTLRRLARRVLLLTADAMLTYTDRGRIACLALGIPQDRVFVSRNTLDTAKLQAIEETIEDSEVSDLRQMFTSENGALLLFVGRLQHVKRVDLLIDTVELLRREGHRSTLIVIGDGPERTLLEDRAAGVDSVRFVGAIYDERDLAPYFMAADLLVIPGRIGLTCVHAFSHGLPVVTASDDVMPQTPEYDYIEDGENGVIVEALTAPAFSRAIATLLADRAQLERLKTGARKAANQLTMDQTVDGFLAAIRYATGRTH